MVRARQYPWGVVQVENDSHCDFTKLREMLIRTNMEDLRDTTHSKHYEVYRKDRLQQMGFSDNDGQPGNFAEQYATRRESHLTALQQKEEEMRQKFVIRVKEKESELKEAYLMSKLPTFTDERHNTKLKRCTLHHITR